MLHFIMTSKYSDTHKQKITPENWVWAKSKMARHQTVRLFTFSKD